MSVPRGSLPNRPNASAGPSRTRPPQNHPPQARHGSHQQSNSHLQQNTFPYQQPQAYFQPQMQPGLPIQMYPYPQNNLSGGYQTAYNVQGFGGYGYTQPQMPMPMPMPMPPVPMHMPVNQPQSFGRAMFHKPTSTPEGYSYSATYTQLATNNINPNANQRNERPPPTKRPRTDTGMNMKGVKAWRNCSHPGCKFVGPGEDVEIHEGDRHLIFPNGPKIELSEEEERFARNHKGPPPPVLGTNITLNTEEEIAKWIAQRKAKFPSKQRIEEKEAEQQAAIARGDLPTRQDRGPKSKRRNDPASIAEDWGRDDSASQNRSDIQHSHRESFGRGRGRGRDRDRGRGGRGGAFRGRGGHHQPSASSNPTQAIPITVGTTEGETTRSFATKATTTPSIPVLAGYCSASPSDSDSSSGSSSESDSESDSEYSDSTVKKGNGNTAKMETDLRSSSPIRSREPCKFFARGQKCKMGDKCKFPHVKPPPRVDVSPKQVRQPFVKKNNNAFERPSMLGALLANPINNTLSQLSQTIRFLVANDMLEGVELFPGQAAENERKETVVQEADEVYLGQEKLSEGEDNSTAPA